MTVMQYNADTNFIELISFRALEHWREGDRDLEYSILLEMTPFGELGVFGFLHLLNRSSTGEGTQRTGQSARYTSIRFDRQDARRFFDKVVRDDRTVRRAKNAIAYFFDISSGCPLQASSAVLRHGSSNTLSLGMSVQKGPLQVVGTK
jgi:hypothetical protein